MYCCMRTLTLVWEWEGRGRHSPLSGFYVGCFSGRGGKDAQMTLLLWLWLQENSGQQSQVTMDAPSDHGVYSFQFNK